MTYAERCTQALVEIADNLLDHFFIYIWPDCTWCHESELEEYQWKSDDFRVALVKCELSDDEIENLVTQELL